MGLNDVELHGEKIIPFLTPPDDMEGVGGGLHLVPARLSYLCLPQRPCAFGRRHSLLRIIRLYFCCVCFPLPSLLFIPVKLFVYLFAIEI